MVIDNLTMSIRHPAAMRYRAYLHGLGHRLSDDFIAAQMKEQWGCTVSFQSVESRPATNPDANISVFPVYLRFDSEANMMVFILRWA